MQSFDELIELASKGNARNVDQYSDDFLKASTESEGEDNVYTKAKKAKPAASGQGMLACCFTHTKKFELMALI
jgi:hypothetical protein